VTPRRERMPPGPSRRRRTNRSYATEWRRSGSCPGWKKKANGPTAAILCESETQTEPSAGGDRPGLKPTAWYSATWASGASHRLSLHNYKATSKTSRPLCLDS